MKTLASRILPGNIEVRGHVENERNDTQAFDFFCNLFRKKSSGNAAYDTEEEFGVSVHVEKKENKFSDKKTYDVYITKKEHP